MQTIRIEHQGPVTTITLARPKVRNAFNNTMAAELAEAFEGLSSTCRIAVLTGEGKAFCAGADLDWMKASANFSPADNVRDAQHLVRLLRAIDEAPQAVIGRINGTALGGGLGLISCCDLVVANEEARFGFTEVRLGLVPAVISPFVLNKIPLSQARRFFITGEIFGAATARNIGLVHDITPLDALDAQVQHWVDSILSCGPRAVGQAKSLLRRISQIAPLDALDDAVHTIARLRTSEEGQEGLGAFLEKRRPSWVIDPQGSQG